MKRRLCRREAKRTVTLTCAEGTLHGAKLCFIFHAPQVRFIEKSHSLYANGFFLGRGRRIRFSSRRRKAEFLISALLRSSVSRGSVAPPARHSLSLPLRILLIQIPCQTKTPPKIGGVLFGRGRRIRTRDPRFWRNCIQSQKFYVSKRKSALDKGGMTTNCRRLWQKKCQQGLFVLAVGAWRFPFPVKFSGNSRLHNIWAGNKLQSTDKASDSQRNLNAENSQIPTCRG